MITFYEKVYVLELLGKSLMTQYLYNVLEKMYMHKTYERIFVMSELIKERNWDLDERAYS